MYYKLRTLHASLHMVIGKNIYTLDYQFSSRGKVEEENAATVHHKKFIHKLYKLISYSQLTSVALPRCIAPSQHVNELRRVDKISTIPLLRLGEVCKVTGSEMRAH